MGELTVKACFKKYPLMNEQEMARLLGSSSYNENTIISATNVANYNGKYAQPLSVFYAQQDTQKFLPKLGESKQKQVMQQAQVDPQKVNGLKEKTQTNNNDYRHFGSNENNRSIFDIERERRKKKLI